MHIFRHPSYTVILCFIREVIAGLSSLDSMSLDNLER